MEYTLISQESMQLSRHDRDTPQDRILVFIPAYNCAPQISRVLAQFKAVPEGTFAEILIVDNRSTDATVDVATRAAAEMSTPVKVVRNSENYGLGGSHKSAFAYAAQRDFDYVVILHGDDQAKIVDLLPVLRVRMHHKFDACLGARFMPGSQLHGYSKLRTLGNHAFNLLFSLVLKKRIWDLGAGLNMVSRAAYTNPEILRYSDDLRFNCYFLIGQVRAKTAFTYFPISWSEEDQLSNARIVRMSLGIFGLLGSYLTNRKGFGEADHRDKPQPSYVSSTVFINSAGQAMENRTELARELV